MPTLPVGSNPIKTSIPCYLWTDAILNPETMTATTMGVKGADKLRVGIKMVVNQAGQALLNQHGDINRTRKILADDTLCETIVVIDNHITPSAKFADILLPETRYLEAEDLVDSSYSTGSHNYMIAIQKTITPMWEVRSTYDICADIAGHLGQPLRAMNVLLRGGHSPMSNEIVLSSLFCAFGGLGRWGCCLIAAHNACSLR